MVSPVQAVHAPPSQNCVPSMQVSTPSCSETVTEQSRCSPSVQAPLPEPEPEPVPVVPPDDDGGPSGSSPLQAALNTIPPSETVVTSKALRSQLGVEPCRGRLPFHLVD
jgi:hypothetical protein